MANPFSGILSTEFSNMFNNAIDAMLANDGVTRPCRLTMGGTKWTDCKNCKFNSATGKSSNVYDSSTGVIPFTTGVCPYCAGVGRFKTESTEVVNMCVLWDYRDWFQWGSQAAKVAAADGQVQTLSTLSTLTVIKQSISALLDTTLEPKVKHIFSRLSEPNPIGLTTSRYILTMWQRKE